MIATSLPVLPAEHRWPVAVAFGEVVLDPFTRRCLEEWERVRSANLAWLSPWDATTPPGGHRQTAEEMVKSFKHEAGWGRLVPWVIRLDHGRRDRPIVGQCTLSGILYGSVLSASVGYWIDQRYAGRGITPRAVALATDYAMRVMRLHRVEICIRPENKPSQRVVEKLGFRYEGIRTSYIHIAGDWRDHLCFALTAEEAGDGLCARIASQQ